jgi:phosphoglycolate phosphatase-like HAD superfamily hydrolase
MHLNSVKMIFWDFDGVIKESVSVKTDAFVEIFHSYGLGVEKKVRLHHIKNGGMSRFDKIPLYLKWSGVEPTNSKVNKISNQFSMIVKNKVINSDWVPGVEAFIQSNKKKYIFIIVSATPQKELKDICRKLNISNYFDKIYGSPTSKSDAIKVSIENYGILPQKCLMFGDAMTDLKAAKENNINFIFRRHKYNQNLKIDSKTLIIDNFTQI